MRGAYASGRFTAVIRTLMLGFFGAIALSIDQLILVAHGAVH